MLRPALLLPPKRLLTSRFNGRDLPRRRRPATRVPGGSLDRTFTGWRHEAEELLPVPTESVQPRVFVTTHHGEMVEVPP